MSEVDTSAEPTSEGEVNQDAQAVSEIVNDVDYSWVQDKYRADGRSDSDAAMEQAKAYNELSKKFGSFTGAPDEYNLTLSEDLIEQGVDISAEDAIYQPLMEMSKELGLNQEGFDRLMNTVGMGQLAEIEVHNQFMQDELTNLGSDATKRLENISKWGQANLPTEMIEAFESMAVNAQAVKAMEKMISMTRSAPMTPVKAEPAAADLQKVKEMQFALDDNGNRKMATDPEYRRMVEKMMNEVYPGDANEVIG